MNRCQWAGCRKLVGDSSLCVAHLAEDAALGRDDDNFDYPLAPLLPGERAHSPRPASRAWRAAMYPSPDETDEGDLLAWMVANGWLTKTTEAMSA